MTISNQLTIMRIVLIPIFVVVYFLPIPYANWISWFIFAIAAVTDWLDGYLARKLGQMSNLGAFLDPVADKLLVLVAFILVVWAYGTVWAMAAAILTVSREITISALREWMAQRNLRAKVAVGPVGKWKTMIQLVGLGTLIVTSRSKVPFAEPIGITLLWFSVFLALYSMVQYLLAAKSALLSSEMSAS